MTASQSVSICLEFIHDSRAAPVIGKIRAKRLYEFFGVEKHRVICPNKSKGVNAVSTEIKMDVQSFVQDKLFSMQDEKYRLFQCKLMPTVPPDEVIGVRAPALRAFAKELIKTPYADCFTDILPHRYYEENNLHGMIVERQKNFELAVEQLDRFLPYINNWATCDLIRPKVFAKNTNKLIEHIERWIATGDTYTVRFGIEMLMTFYLDDKFRTEYLEIAAQVRSDRYYVNMMTAWFFATALAKQYRAALPFLENRRLDVWTHNKAIQKSCESRRLTEQQKAYLKSLKVR